MPVTVQSRTGDDWSAYAKLALVIEEAPMLEAELSTYCRGKSLDVEQIR